MYPPNHGSQDEEGRLASADPRAPPPREGHENQECEPSVLSHKRFWEQWNELSREREVLLRQRGTKWEKIARSLEKTNRLLRLSPDSKLARIARLSLVEDGFDLTTPACVVYAVCGPFPTYVGQCGAIEGVRPLIERFREHCEKARALRNHYMGCHGKRRSGAIKQGELPSLARVLARHGCHKVTIFPLERVTDENASERERFWERVLSPTLNQKIPYGGVDRLTWEFLTSDGIESPENKTLKSRTEFMMRRDLGPNDLSSAWEFLCQVNKHVEPNLFERLFRKLKCDVRKQWGTDLPRRIVIKVPSYAQEVLDVVHKTITGEINKLPLPPGLGHWLSRVVNAISAPTPKIESFAKVSRSVVVNRVAEELEAWNSHLSFAEWDACGESDGLWKVQVGSSRVFRKVQTQVQKVVRERLVTERCLDGATPLPGECDRACDLTRL